MKLIYFDIPGKAEAIRLCAAVGGVQLDDVRTSREKFHEMRDSGELPFGQVPALDVGDGRILAQSSAILRYVATLGGLHPTDPLEAAHVDAVAAAEEDFFAGISVSRYGARFGFEMSDEYRAQVRKALNDEVLPRHLSALQKKLEASKTGWLAGTEKNPRSRTLSSPRGWRWLVGGANDGNRPGPLRGVSGRDGAPREILRAPGGCEMVRAAGRGGAQSGRDALAERELAS